MLAPRLLLHCPVLGFPEVKCARHRKTCLSRFCLFSFVIVVVPFLFFPILRYVGVEMLVCFLLGRITNTTVNGTKTRTLLHKVGSPRREHSTTSTQPLRNPLHVKGGAKSRGTAERLIKCINEWLSLQWPFLLFLRSLSPQLGERLYLFSDSNADLTPSPSKSPGTKFQFSFSPFLSYAAASDWSRKLFLLGATLQLIDSGKVHKRDLKIALPLPSLYRFCVVEPIAVLPPSLL